MTAAPPTIRVDKGIDEALAPERLRTLPEDVLRPFLLQRRWFGAKGRSVHGVRVVHVIPVAAEEARAAIVVLEVELGAPAGAADASPTRLLYQLPLAARADDEGARPLAVLARIEGAGDRDRGVLHDATEDPEFRRMLARAFERGATLEGEDATWRIAPVAGTPAGIAELESKVGAAEQSNTSVIFGDRAILKFFRRLERGDNPDVEIGRYLTALAHFPNTPPLLGEIVLEPHGRESARRMTAGILQRYMAGSRDAWEYTLEQNRAYFAAPGEEPGRHPFLTDAERLGRVTRALHDALAAGTGPDFAPEPVRQTDVNAWAEATRRQVEEAVSLLADRLEAGAIPTDRRPEATVLVRRGDEYAAFANELSLAVGDNGGQRIRHHGDYHLGQVLRTPGGDFMIIDFEGEPARPLAERRAKHSPLRDVAGMLRSFAYAAATLAGERRERSASRALEIRAARWERETREAYLRGYLAGGRAPFLPSTPEALDALLTLFEAEKVFYELSYELNNRPDWVGIPMRGISKLLVDKSGGTAGGGGGSSRDRGARDARGEARP